MCLVLFADTQWYILLYMHTKMNTHAQIAQISQIEQWSDMFLYKYMFLVPMLLLRVVVTFPTNAEMIN